VAPERLALRTGSPERGAADPALHVFGGVTVLWLDGIEALRAAIDQDPAVAATLDDDKFFIDGSRSTACIADEPFDGIVHAFFHCIATSKALVGHRLAHQESFNDEENFIDHSRSVELLTRRYVIKDLIRWRGRPREESTPANCAGARRWPISAYPARHLLVRLARPRQHPSGGTARLPGPGAPASSSSNTSRK